MYISSDGDYDYDDASRHEGQHQQQTQMTNTLSQDWLPPATSTPLLATVVVAAAATDTATRNPHRSEREIENELFQNIQNLIQEFLHRRNRHYPCYQVTRLMMSEQSQLEYILTVVINRPTIILE
jgi:hypothetical protein